ncbi:MAG: hypothetical protein ACP5O1_10440 [Phycisphaerae bacterium]
MVSAVTSVGRAGRSDISNSPDNRMKVDVQAGGVNMQWDNNSVEAVEPTRDAMHSR